MEKNKITINLSAMLGRRRLTQKWLADKTGIRRNTIADLYNEFAASVKFEHLIAICEVLECSLAELMEYEPSTKKE